MSAITCFSGAGGMDTRADVKRTGIRTVMGISLSPRRAGWKVQDLADPAAYWSRIREDELSAISSWVTAPSSSMERMSTVDAAWGSWERASWTAADCGSMGADFTEGGTICSSVMGLPSLSRYTPSLGMAAEAVKPRVSRRDREMRIFFIGAPLIDLHSG